MSDNSITRVNYFEGQFLRTQDFTEEQDYHVAMRRRHNISHHTWGIVSGLEIVEVEGNFYVQPGMAVDGYGRELILPQKQALSSTAFKDKASTELDVWLVYGLKSLDKLPPGYAGCGNGKGGTSFYRWQETAQVILEKPDPDFPDRRQPEGLIIADRNFDASRTPPDSPKSYWPVFLGTISNDPGNQQQPLAVKLDNRPYVGLVGGAIEAPSGRARVQVGSERDDDLRRFVVFTRDESQPQTAAKWLPRFAVHEEGDVSVRGDASIYGNLSIAGGVIEFGAGTARDPELPPWNIYRLSSDEPAGVDELRIEMAATPAGGIAGNNRVVIGAWFKGPDENGQEKEQFQPCLIISDDLSVEVIGNLIVKGQITARKIVEGQLTDAARNAAAAALMSGILATTGRLPEISDRQSPGPNALFRNAASVSVGSPAEVAGLADSVASNPALIAAFAEHMKTSHPREAESLLKALS